MTTQTVITLLDEHASVCRQRDRLMHERDTALTRAEASEGKLVAMTAARDEACEIVEELTDHMPPKWRAEYAEDIVRIRKVGT